MPELKGLRLANEQVCLRILPERGGKVASMLDLRRDFELLYQPRKGYSALKPGMAFSEGDASGFDDVFPSMGEPWTDPFTGEERDLPDHGEIWTARMEVDSITDQTVRMHTFGRCFPFRYEKEISLLEHGMQERITVVNQGAESFPCLWVCHCLMKAEEEMQFTFPEGAEEIECIPGCSWPPEGQRVSILKDLQLPPPNNVMMKFYFRDPITEGVCGVAYPRSGIRAVLRFSPEQLPYLGFWMTTGGYRGESNFAFEPASGYYDTLKKAQETGRLPILRPGEKAVYETEITMTEGDC